MKNPLSADGLDTATDVENYHYGQLKDATDDTSQDGTVIDKVLLADIRTAFMRAVRLTGIPINDQFDTENSSQLFDACFGTTKVPITTFYNEYYNSDETYVNPLRIWKEKGGKEVRIEGWIRGGNAGINVPIFLLPEGYRPTKLVNSVIVGYGSNQVTVTKLRYNYENYKVEIESEIGELSSLGYINWSIPID